MVSFCWKGKKKAGRVDLDKEESSNKVSSYLLATFRANDLTAGRVCRKDGTLSPGGD